MVIDTNKMASTSGETMKDSAEEGRTPEIEIAGVTEGMQRMDVATESPVVDVEAIRITMDRRMRKYKSNLKSKTGLKVNFKWDSMDLASALANKLVHCNHCYNCKETVDLPAWKSISKYIHIHHM